MNYPTNPLSNVSHLPENPGKTHWAIFQVGGPVYGTGKTIDDAIADANIWLDETVEYESLKRYHWGRMTAGNLYLAPCSYEFHCTVQEDGGDLIYYEVSDGLDLRED